MALIKCNECGHTISDKASVCPNCGCPIQGGATSDDVINKEPKSKKKWIWALVAVLLCLIVGGGYFIFSTIGSNGKNAIVELTPEFIEKIQKYDKLGAFSEGLAAVCKDDKWGYINTKGDIAIPIGIEAINLEAYEANAFSEGLAVIFTTSNNFIVIDIDGNIVFSGECDTDRFGEDVDWVMKRCNYIQGKLYIPIANSQGDDMWVIYDKQGNKIKTVEYSEIDSVLDSQEKRLYTQSYNEIGRSEDKYYTFGLKDSVGPEILPAIYSDIEYNCNEGKVSNGVFRVVLEELGEDVDYGYAGTWYSEDTKYYYGYADLKGNDTFSDEIKKKCKLSHERAANTLYEKEQREEEMRLMREGPDWLQGAWRMSLTDDYGNLLGYAYEVFDHGKTKTYMNGGLILEREYTISGNMILYQSGHYFLDNTRQVVISANGDEMKKVSSDPSYTPTGSSSGSYSYGSGSTSYGSHRFTSAADVMGWLSDKTFRNGGTTVRVRQDGIWIRGNCMTYAPVVEKFESWKALIRANTITPGGMLSIIVDPINGKIVDGTGASYSLQ